ncbi:MAG: hypothetical protein ACREFR_09970 [Limisphaerales bacterium]
MKDDGYDPGLFIKMSSALFATMLSAGVVLVEANKFSRWSQIGDAERFWSVFALSYAALLAILGYIFAVAGWCMAGFIHAALMLGIAGFCFYLWSGNLNAPLADSPAAGIIAIATLVYFIVGALAALFGLGTAYLLFGKSARNGQ